MSNKLVKTIRRYCGREFIRNCSEFAIAPRRARRAHARLLHRSRTQRGCTWSQQWATTALMYQRIRCGG